MIIKRYDAEAQKLLGSKVKPEPWLHVVITNEAYFIYVWDTRQIVGVSENAHMDSPDRRKDTDYRDLIKEAKTKLVNAIDNFQPLVEGKFDIFDHYLGPVRNKFEQMLGKNEMANRDAKSADKNYVVVSLAQVQPKKHYPPLPYAVRAVEYHSKSDAIDAICKPTKGVDYKLLVVVSSLVHYKASANTYGVDASYYAKRNKHITIFSSGKIKASSLKLMHETLSSDGDKPSKSIAGKYITVSKWGDTAYVFDNEEIANEAKKHKIELEHMGDRTFVEPKIVKIEATQVD